MSKVINFFSGPGAGKSTAATGLFSKMKMAGHICEYVSEYAKDLTGDQFQKLLENQLHVSTEQFRRQLRWRNKVDYIITDSPLILGIVYINYHEGKTIPPYGEKVSNSTKRLIFDMYEDFNNINVHISRNKPYVAVGRNQTEKEATEVDQTVKSVLDSYKIPIHLHTTSTSAIDDTYSFILRAIEQSRYIRVKDGSSV